MFVEWESLSCLSEFTVIFESDLFFEIVLYENICRDIFRTNGRCIHFRSSYGCISAHVVLL
jgi:hypothetical protein